MLDFYLDPEFRNGNASGADLPHPAKAICALPEDTPMVGHVRLRDQTVVASDYDDAGVVAGFEIVRRWPVVAMMAMCGGAHGWVPPIWRGGLPNMSRRHCALAFKHWQHATHRAEPRTHLRLQHTI